MAIKKSPIINSVIKEYSDSTFDFGFTTDVEIIDNSDKIEDYKQRLKKVEELIMPLLINLSKNSENPIIKWSNRSEILEQKIQELLKLTRE